MGAHRGPSRLAPGRLTVRQDAAVGSPVAVAPRLREVVPELVRVVPDAVAGGAGLDPPALREGPQIDDVEAEVVENARDRRASRGVVAGDDERAPMRGAGGGGVGGELAVADVVERLHDAGG